MESDSKFLDRLKRTWLMQGDIGDWSRLFALARKGAEAGSFGGFVEGCDYLPLTRKGAAHTETHTDDKRAHSAFANSENARIGEQRTICEACGNTNLAHDRAAWTEDGTSYCPQCFPAAPPPKQENENE